MKLGNHLHLLGRHRAMEAQLDEFLDQITKASLTFLSAIECYLLANDEREFDHYLTQVEKIESHGDNLRRTIEVELYQQTLIPDLRGDVMRLLEDLDGLINICQGNLFRFSIQQPQIPAECNSGYLQLTKTVITCVEAVVLASRAFFRDISAIRDHIAKVMFYETEADRISTAIQRTVFASKLALEEKRQLCYFVEHIDNLANAAEDVGDTITIYAIKRRL
ncbi:MAG TPA: DUF47 family protein [Gammaproteobacteria bacterium]|nr:DUF47 family protein [Gammaproteobacteria bacterium]